MCEGGGSMIGKYGNVIFTVSDKKIQTFDNFDMEVEAKWSEIQRMGYKPLLEYTGRKLRRIRFDMTLNVGLGVSVRKTLEKLEKMAESKKTHILIIGNKRIGRNKWVLKNLGEKFEHIMSKGEIVQATVNISLEEYIEKRNPSLIKRKIKKKPISSERRIRKKRSENILSKIAKEVICGKWGVNPERRRRLEAAGYSYQMVQKVVNQILKGKK